VSQESDQRDAPDNVAETGGQEEASKKMRPGFSAGDDQEKHFVGTGNDVVEAAEADQVGDDCSLNLIERAKVKMRNQPCAFDVSYAH
jgi:hypothetical protein